MYHELGLRSLTNVKIHHHLHEFIRMRPRRESWFIHQCMCPSQFTLDYPVTISQINTGSTDVNKFFKFPLSGNLCRCTWVSSDLGVDESVCSKLDLQHNESL